MAYRRVLCNRAGNLMTEPSAAQDTCLLCSALRAPTCASAFKTPLAAWTAGAEFANIIRFIIVVELQIRNDAGNPDIRARRSELRQFFQENLFVRPCFSILSNP